MEFFAQIERHNLDIENLKHRLQIASLPQHCSAISTANAVSDTAGDIYCIWGQFDVSREVIRFGVRFALLNCPHALAWTITYHDDLSMLVVHCIIDDREVDEEFAESIEAFIADWETGLSKAFP